MIITAGKYPFSANIIPCIDGKKSDVCQEIDTDKNIAMVWSSITDGEIAYKMITGKVQFKLKRGKNIPEPFLTELTNDHGFIGFED